MRGTCRGACRGAFGRDPQRDRYELLERLRGKQLCDCRVGKLLHGCPQGLIARDSRTHGAVVRAEHYEDRHRMYTHCILCTS